jgi:hypothetical protein
MGWFCIQHRGNVSFLEQYILEYTVKITQTPTILTRTNGMEKRPKTKGGKKESKKDGLKYFCFFGQQMA